LDATKPVTVFGRGGSGSVLIGSDVVDGPLPDAFEGVIVNVYSVSGSKPGNVRDVPDVVCVVVGGKETMEYEDAYNTGSHAKSIVVSVGLLATKPVTASGGGGRVVIGSDVVDGPLPDAFDGVIVNVYSWSGVRPVNVRVVPDVVCVVDEGTDSIEYSVA
jgi:hypothetical protein